MPVLVVRLQGYWRQACAATGTRLGSGSWLAPAAAMWVLAGVALCADPLALPLVLTPPACDTPVVWLTRPVLCPHLLSPACWLAALIRAAHIVKQCQEVAMIGLARNASPAAAAATASAPATTGQAKPPAFSCPHAAVNGTGSIAADTRSHERGQAAGGQHDQREQGECLGARQRALVTSPSCLHRSQPAVLVGGCVAMRLVTIAHLHSNHQPLYCGPSARWSSLARREHWLPPEADVPVGQRLLACDPGRPYAVVHGDLASMAIRARKVVALRCSLTLPALPHRSPSAATALTA